MITNETKVAWLGAGTMGGPMAANLAKAGFRVTVWNRSKTSPWVEFAASRGCVIAKTVEEALEGSRVVCSCVTDGPALRSILFAEGRELKRLLGGGAPALPEAGKTCLRSEATARQVPAVPVVVDFSTIGPVEARGLSEQLRVLGLRFVDAPVTGGDIGAREGTLTFMVGASGEDLETIRPLLNAMGKKVVHAGPVGSGQSLKLVNQLLCGVNLLAVVEAFQAAEAMGMDRKLVVEACGGGAAGSWQLVNLGPKIIAQDHRPGFRAAHLLKDLRFLRDALGNGQSERPCFEAALEAFQRITEMGKGEQGSQTVWMAHPEKQKPG